MRKDDRFNTELDTQLQALATTDWVTFANIIGEDALLSAKVCLLRNRGNSMQQIANRLDISKSKVQYCIKNQYKNIHVKEKEST
jgi:ATP/maltotriose-dependent transcriptional regulator MalT